MITYIRASGCYQQVLAALEGRLQTALAAGCEHGLGDDPAQLRHAGLADAPARHLAGGAAEYDQVARAELAGFAQGGDGYP